MMRFILPVLVFCGLIGTSHSEKTSTKVCPLLGPEYPLPTTLKSNHHFQRATKKIEAALNASLTTGLSPNDGPGPFNKTTFSIGIFSTTEKDLLYEFHYTDPFVRNGSFGTQHVDANSVYRLGSIGKILSVYIFLIRDGDVHWNDPITKYVPELVAAAANGTSSTNGVLPSWDEITLGQLASQTSGLPRDYGVSDSSFPWVDHTGFPDIPDDQLPTCNYFLPNNTFITCSREQYLAGMITEPALFKSGATPVYSNNAFVLLALALEKITGDSLGKIFNESLVDGLGLSSTSFDVPSTFENGVIPGDPTAAGWDSRLGAFSAAGAYFSSTNEMATIAKSILNSTLLSKAQTRRWLKPAMFTANINSAVGYPWEIFRTQINGRTVDLYAKNGGWGAYSTEIFLVPDYDFGFVILTASTLGSDATNALVYVMSDMIGAEIFPAFEDAAKDQAKENFAGTYKADNLNSSLTIAVDDQPGLRITQWVSNGTVFIAMDPSGDNYTDFRLQPNRLYSGNQVGFTGTLQELPVPKYPGPLDVSCLPWATVDSNIYGNVGFEEFVFRVDAATGKAISVQPKALRIEMLKQG